ncbi:hypothetical protein EVG80_15455 [Salmonella enterica subsp. enterica serovar Mississippi]|nr:hypothetical protein [Salmonella enterica subsp. enterica serovar Mississippi]
MSVFFNGQLLVTPTTASAVNDDAMLNQNLSVGNAVAFVGLAQGGKPFEILSFGSPDDARNLLIGGELCDAVIGAFAPSVETGSPQTVYAVRVNTIQAPSLTLKAANSLVTLGTIKGLRYSTEDLVTRFKVEQNGLAQHPGQDQGPNTTPHTLHLIDITASGKTRGVEWSVKGTAINKPSVVIDVLEDDVLLNFEPSVNTVKVRIDAHSNAHDEQFLMVSYDAFPTLEALASHLKSLRNGDGKQVFDITFENEGDKDLAVTVLDPGTYSAKGNHYLAWTGWAFQNWFYRKLGDYVALELEPATAGSLWEGPAPHDWTYLSAPTPPAVTSADWERAISLLSTRDVQWVQAVTDLEGVHAQVAAHVQFCSTTGKRERRAILGTGVGTTDAEAIRRAKALNSPRVSLVHIGHYAYDLAGKLVLRPAYMTAGLVAAGFAGLNPGTPMTNKSIAVQGLERDLRNPTDTDALILGGVMPIENTETGYKVTQSITTWLGNSKYNLREQSCGVAVDFAIRNVRQALEPLRGAKQSPILLSRAISTTKGALMELSRPEPQGPEVLVGDENHPAWRNVTATVEGDVLRVQFEASPAIPNNYILVTMYAVPYSGSATA